MRLKDGQVRISGEVSGTTSGPDDEGFFNYTDYERNALRTFRASVGAMWQPSDRFAVLTEVRSDDMDDLTIRAAYVRVRPWRNRPFDIQAGRIPPVFGAYGRRSYQSDQALIGYPLGYQYLTSLRADALPSTVEDLVNMRGRGWRSSFPIGSPAAGPGLPLMSALKWDTGVQASWAGPAVDAAVAVTTGTLANPRVQDDNGGKQVAGRVAGRPAIGLVLGLSASRGSWISNSVHGAGRGKAQTAFGADAEYSRGYAIVRGEMIWSRWDLPFLAATGGPDDLTAVAGWIEGRYRLSPRIYVAARADALDFSQINSLSSGRLPWDAPVRRSELGAGYSIQRNVVLRGSVQFNERSQSQGRTFLTAQLSYWF